MTRQSCCVPGCGASYKDNAPHLAMRIIFYAFPGKPYEEARKKTWIKFVRRRRADGSPWTPGKNSVICSKHFIGNTKSRHPLNPNYNPTIHPLTSTEEEKKIAVKVGRLMRYKKRMQMKLDPQYPPIEDIVMPESMESLPKEMVESCTQTEKGKRACRYWNLTSFICNIDSGNLSTQVSHAASYSTGTSTDVVTTKDASTGEGKSSIPTERNQTDKEALKGLAAVSPLVFDTLANLLPNYEPGPKALGKQDCLLLCLIKLRLGLSYTALEHLFEVGRITTQRIFARTMPILCEQTKSWLPWPTRATTTTAMPDHFKKCYPNCRVILDWIEIRTERPAQAEKELLMYSEDQKCCTVKVLIGMTASGLITFLSKAYGGKSTDAFAVTDSGLLNLLEAGDVVMVGKGFTGLEKLLEEKGVVLVRVSEIIDNQNPRILWDVRGHLKRILDKVKTFNVLNNVLPTELLHHVDSIVHLCSVVTNLQQNKVRIQYKKK